MLKLSYQEAMFLLTLLESDRQTALQLLHAEHFYKPTLLPRLSKLVRELKAEQ